MHVLFIAEKKRNTQMDKDSPVAIRKAKKKQHAHA